MVFATVMTQLLARFTTMLDSRKKVPMTGRVYLRAIVPIGVFFSLSLMFSNMTYIHLSVAFIQMLKVRRSSAVMSADRPGHDPRRDAPRNLESGHDAP
jgi:hypothetical protein